FVRIGHQRERQFLLGGEIGVGLRRVARDADDLGVAFAELRVQVAEVLRFGGTAGGGVLGVEIQHYPLALEVGEPERGAVAGGAAEGGGLLSEVWHGLSGNPTGFRLCARQRLARWM